MSRDFIFRIKEGQPLPPVDPSGHRVLLDERTGLFKLLTSTGEVIEAPGAAAASTSEYTETIINITSATTTYSDERTEVASGILAMGTSPIELLPVAGANQYYEYYGFGEYSYQTALYTAAAGTDIVIGNIDNWQVKNISMNVLTSEAENIAFQFSSDNVPEYSAGNNRTVAYYTALNKAIMMTTNNSGDFMSGYGALRIKIYHKKKYLWCINIYCCHYFFNKKRSSQIGCSFFFNSYFLLLLELVDFCLVKGSLLSKVF